MQEREDTDQRLMRVHGRLGRPPAEQAALLFERESSPLKPLGALIVQPFGRVDEDQTASAGEPEELPQLESIYERALQKGIGTWLPL